MINKQTKCSGCAACQLICPKNCIKMKLNEYGFYRPTVNPSECINCGLCIKVCPFEQNSSAYKLDDCKLYSAFTNDSKIRKTSSSGGIAYYIANDYLMNKSIVCGVEYNFNERRAEHILVNNHEKLLAIQKSKYLQSYTYDGFRRLIHSLNENTDANAVVFGTPCQITGLEKLLTIRHMRDRVLLVEIFCHGTPSYLLWNSYLQYLKSNIGIEYERIKQLDFRDKKYSWHEYYMHIITNQKEYVKNRDIDPFLRLFCQGVMNQKSCFTCPYRNMSFADIRLGDYWGKRYASSEKGYSMIIPITNKGVKYWNKISNNDDITVLETSINERFGQQTDPYSVPKYYEKSFKMLKEGDSILKVYKLYNRPDQIIREKLRKFVNKYL